VLRPTPQNDYGVLGVISCIITENCALWGSSY